MSRLRAETMPAVTVPPRLNGLPIAITHSPSRSLSESPNFTATSGLAGLNFSTARSVFLSTPTISALILVPSFMMTLISSASAMTWLLVTTTPAVSTMKPEPSELVLRGCESPFLSPPLRRRRAAAVLEEIVEELLERRTRRQLRRSRVAPPLASTVCEVEILTTASITFSATSAMPSGPRAQAGADEGAGGAKQDRGQHGAQALASRLLSQQSYRLLSRANTDLVSQCALAGT